MTSVLQGAVQGAVMGLIIEFPGHGHDIGRRFEDRFRGVIGSGRQHVYPHLYALHDAGLLDASSESIAPAPPSRRQRGDSYRATADGVSAWRAWLAAPLTSRAPHQEMFARMLAARRQDWRTLLVILDHYEAAVRAQAAERTPHWCVDDRDDLAVMLAREYESAQLEASLSWVERARERILGQRRDR